MLMFRKYTRIVIIAVICTLAPVLINAIGNAQTVQLGTTNMERYSYKYIVGLYEQGDSSTLLKEIKLFYAKYPSSELLSYVQLIEANVHMEQGQYTQALELYDKLIGKDIDLSLRHELYLNRALTLYALGESDQAMTQVQFLQSETKNPSLLAEANLLRARLYKKAGQYFSALKAYDSAIIVYPEDQEISYERFEVLVKLGREDEAEELLSQVTDSTEIGRAHV